MSYEPLKRNKTQGKVTAKTQKGKSISSKTYRTVVLVYLNCCSSCCWSPSCCCCSSFCCFCFCVRFQCIFHKYAHAHIHKQTLALALRHFSASGDRCPLCLWDSYWTILPIEGMPLNAISFVTHSSNTFACTALLIN